MNEKKQIEEEEKMITLFEKEIEKKLPVRMDAHMPAGSRVKAIELEIRPFRNLYEVVIDKKRVLSYGIRETGLCIVLVAWEV
ncbi:MAG TPA: hypothetical protein VJZ01_08910 [Lachnospiraceae bacterium]|nr:hypothetical protein [Lachnospiraceae bacterium]